jgi:hypothetical protein
MNILNNSDIIIIFRKVWYYFLLYNLFDENSNETTKELFEACQIVARYSPILKGVKLYNYLEIKTEIESLIDKSRTPDVNAVINTLPLILPKSTNLKKIKSDKAIFLLLVYHLETLRVRSGTMQYIMLYLDDQSFIDIPEIYKNLILIVETCFEKWLAHLRSFTYEERSNFLEDNFIYLLKLLCHRNQIIRELSYKFIDKILSKHHEIYWNYNCLKVLFNLLNELKKGFKKYNF